MGTTRSSRSIEDLARRIDGLERMTTNLSEDLLLGHRRIHQLRSRFAVASVLLSSGGLLAGAWVKHTVDPPERLPTRPAINRVSRGPVA